MSCSDESVESRQSRIDPDGRRHRTDRDHHASAASLRRQGKV